MNPRAALKAAIKRAVREQLTRDAGGGYYWVNLAMEPGEEKLALQSQGRTDGMTIRKEGGKYVLRHNRQHYYSAGGGRGEVVGTYSSMPAAQGAALKYFRSKESQRTLAHRAGEAGRLQWQDQKFPAANMRYKAQHQGPNGLYTFEAEQDGRDPPITNWLFFATGPNGKRYNLVRTSSFESGERACISWANDGGPLDYAGMRPA